jgi:hypothetical protein
MSTSVLLPEEVLHDHALDRLGLFAAAASRVLAQRSVALLEAERSARRVDTARGDTVASDFLVLHLAGTLQVDQGAVPALLDEARHLVLRLPLTWQALDDGWLPVAHGRALVELTLGLTAEQCAEVEAAALERAAGRSAGSLRRHVRRLVAGVRGGAEQRRRRALDGRRVTGSALADGMGGVWATMPAGAHVLFLTSLRRLAAAAVVPGDPRTDEQRMSDVLSALPPLVLAMAQGRLGEAVQQAVGDAGIGPVGPAPVQAVLLVPADTAAGTGDEPGELRGHGPVDAGHVRELLRSAQVRTGTVDGHGRLTGLSASATDLRRTARPAPATGLAALLLPPLDEGQLDAGQPKGGRRDDAGSDRVTAAVVAHLDGHDARAVSAQPSEPQYRPSAALTRLVRTRDPHCVGIGCSVPSSRCDTEHRDPWPHGPTSPENLSPLSRRCHRAKQAGWRYVRSRDGTTTWYPPGSRRTYVVGPPPPL